MKCLKHIRKYFYLSFVFIIVVILSFQAWSTDNHMKVLEEKKAAMEFPYNKFLKLEIVDIEDKDRHTVLISPMEPVKFPLTEEDKQFIETLKAKVIELKAAGLAATQVGMASLLQLLKSQMRP